MCLTPWFKAYEATLAPAEIERLDKCLAAAFEGDKNYRLTRWSLQSELRIHRLRLTFLEQTAEHLLVGILCSVHRSLPLYQAHSELLFTPFYSR